MEHVRLLTVLVCVGISAGCASVEEDTKMAKNTFGDDIEFLKKHTEVVLLSDTTGHSQVAVLPRILSEASMICHCRSMSAGLTL